MKPLWLYLYMMLFLCLLHPIASSNNRPIQNKIRQLFLIIFQHNTILTEQLCSKKILFSNAMSSISSFSQSPVHFVGHTPLVPIHKLVKPHKIPPSKCEIHAKCEFRNPSGSIWDRLVCHEMINVLGKPPMHDPYCALVTGGISDLCLSLAWVGAADDSISTAVLPGPNLDHCKLELLQSFGTNVILSYQQDGDANKGNTLERLESHVRKLEATSGVLYKRILPFTPNISDDCTTVGPYDSLIEEVTIPGHVWDVIVCSGQDAYLIQKLKKLSSTLISVDFSGNSFTETFSYNGRDCEMEGVKQVQISDVECYDMARRLVREEGLLVGPISGGVMAVAVKEASSFMESASLALVASSSFPTTQKSILVILPDSLHNTSRDFLSVDWMVQNGHYSVTHLESLFWWYEMAVENINPPEIFVSPPEAQIKSVHALMNTSSLERCVVVSTIDQGQDKHVIGVVTRDLLEEKMKNSSQHETLQIGDVCTKQFGLIDSKANFSELEQLLRKYNFVVNIHRVPVHTFNGKNQQYLGLEFVEDVVGVINMADFIRYKRKIENHHLTEYGLAMSDGIPSGIWLERFNEQLNKVSTTDDKT